MKLLLYKIEKNSNSILLSFATYLLLFQSVKLAIYSFPFSHGEEISAGIKPQTAFRKSVLFSLEKFQTKSRESLYSRLCNLLLEFLCIDYASLLPGKRIFPENVCKIVFILWFYLGITFLSWHFHFVNSLTRKSIQNFVEILNIDDILSCTSIYNTSRLEIMIYTTSYKNWRESS